MNLTRVTIKLNTDRAATDTCVAFAGVVLDDAIEIRDVKVVATRGGRLIVAMPNRKLTGRCPSCRGKNRLQARFCDACGKPVAFAIRRDDADRAVLFDDVCRPVNAPAREAIDRAVLAAYRDALSTRPDADR